MTGRLLEIMTVDHAKLGTENGWTLLLTDVTRAIDHLQSGVVRKGKKTGKKEKEKKRKKILGTLECLVVYWRILADWTRP